MIVLFLICLLLLPYTHAVYFGSNDAKFNDQLREILKVYQFDMKDNDVPHPLPQNVSNDCDQPEPNKLCSYENTVQCRTNAIFRPNTVDEVQNIVKNAVAKGLRVRAVGHGHTDSELWCDNEQAVSIASDGLNKILSINLTTNTIQVEAGVMLGDIHDALHAVNMALLGYYPAYRNFTIAGVTATGSHGSSLSTTSVLADTIVSLDLVDATGNVRTLETNDINLSAARTTLGTLGVVVRITLPIIEQFKIRMQVLTFPDSIMQQPDFLDWIYNGTYVGFAWYPRAQIIVMEHGQKVNSTTPGDGKAITFNQDVTSVKIFASINELLIKHPDLGPLIEVMVAEIQSKSPNYKYPDQKDASVDVTGWSHHIMCGICSTGCPWFIGMRTKETSYGIPLTELPNVVRDITTLLNTSDHSLVSFPLGGIYFRFGKPTTALLGFGRATEWFVAEVTTFRPNDGGSVYNQSGIDDVVALMRDKYKGAPHWGKNENSAFTRAENFSEKYGPNWQTYWSIQKQFDPNGVFLSPFISNFTN